MAIDKLREWCLKMYGEEYTGFLLIDFVDPLRLCPYCEIETIRKLWLGDPAREVDGKKWGKWYMWCESCLRGIYCPLGSFRVPKDEPYIQWGDKVALKQALPLELKLIEHPRIEQQRLQMAME